MSAPDGSGAAGADATRAGAGAAAGRREDVDVVVVGGGVAGLVAARAAAGGGRDVVVLEAAPRAGGLVGSLRVGGMDLDAGAESFATRGGSVAALAAELGLGPAIVTPGRVPARVNHGGASYALPATGVLGIPTDLDAPGLEVVLGAAGLARARRDLELPADATPGDPTLAGLVAARMGEAVVDRLLRPVVRGVHSVEPEEVAAEALLPGVRERIARTGSLAAALADQRAAAPAGSAVQGIDGGVHRLVTALASDLVARGGALRTAAPVTSLTREEGGWVARTAAGRVRARSVLLATPPHTWGFLDAGGEDGVHGGAATALVRLARDWPSPSSVDLLTLVLDATRLGEHERAGVLVSVPGRGAKALTYASAKWDWVARAAGPGRAVVRLSYAAGVVPDDDEARAALALADAGRLLGTRIGREALLDHARTHLTMPRPVRAWGMSQHVAAMRERVAGTTGLEVAGTWIAGTGLASVVPDAQAAGERLAGF